MSHQRDKEDVSQQGGEAGHHAPLERDRHDAVHDEDDEHEVPGHGVSVHLNLAGLSLQVTDNTALIL